MGNIDFIDCPYRVKCTKASAKWQSRAAHFNNLAALASSAMAGVAGAVSRLPFADFEVGRWPLATCAAWYVALVLLMLGVRSWTRPRI